MKFPDRAVYYSVISALVCFFCVCSKSPMAGGSSDSGNARVAAVIHTADGSRAAGASVTICPRNYPGGMQDDSVHEGGSLIKKTSTDDSGRFAIDSLEAGDYYIEVNDRISCSVLLEAVVPPPSNHTITIEDTLHPYAKIEGNAGRASHPNAQRYLLVYGLDRKVPIDSGGRVALEDLPAGMFSFRIVSSDAAFTPVDVDSIAITSGKNLSVPFMGWRHRCNIFLNTSSSGADVSGSVYGFPAVVRLTNANFNFNEAIVGGDDVRFSKSDDTPLAFEIERWDSAGGQAELWVKIDTIFGNNNSQYISLFWGNPNAISASNDNAVFDTEEGFQAVWHLSEANIDSVSDATSNRFNGTALGMTAASMTNGMIGKARAFDGVSSSISVPNTASGKLNFPEDGYYSLSAWVYAEVLDDASHVIVSKGDEQYFLCSVLNSSNVPEWNFDEFRETAGWQKSEWPAIAKQWVYITGVRKGTAQYFYVNGELVDTTYDTVPSAKPRITTFDVAIGKMNEINQENGDSFFHGIIDEVRIHNVSLGSDWIRLCYMNQRKDDRLVVFK